MGEKIPWTILQIGKVTLKKEFNSETEWDSLSEREGAVLINTVKH